MEDLDTTGTFVTETVSELSCETIVDDDTIGCPWLSAVFDEDEVVLDLTSDEILDEETSGTPLLDISDADEPVEVDTVDVATLFADELSAAIESLLDIVDAAVFVLEWRVIGMCPGIPVTLLVITVC